MVVLTLRARRRAPRLRLLAQVVSWVVVTAVGLLLLAAVLVPRMTGATAYVIESGSMRPSLPPGTLVVVRPAQPATLGVGDVITFGRGSGQEIVTHRIVAKRSDPSGGIRWRTQGDANDAADARWVRPQQLLGERWYSLPYVGHVMSALNGSVRSVLLVVCALALGYGVAASRLARRRRSKEQVPARPYPRPQLRDRSEKQRSGVRT